MFSASFELRRHATSLTVYRLIREGAHCGRPRHQRRSSLLLNEAGAVADRDRVEAAADGSAVIAGNGLLSRLARRSG